MHILVIISMNLHGELLVWEWTGTRWRLIFPWWYSSLGCVSSSVLPGVCGQWEQDALHLQFSNLYSEKHYLQRRAHLPTRVDERVRVQKRGRWGCAVRARAGAGVFNGWRCEWPRPSLPDWGGKLALCFCSQQCKRAALKHHSRGAPRRRFCI